MNQNERLRALLAEAQQRIEAGFGNVTARVFFVLTNTLQVDPKAMFEAAEVLPRKRGRPRKDDK